MDKDKYFGISNRITKWKEPSEFEEKLGKAAACSWEARQLYADFYRQLDNDYYEKGKLIALKLYESNHDKSESDNFDDIYVDMVYCLHRYGLSFQDYCVYNLQNKSEKCREQFVSDKLRYHYCDLLNGKNVYQLMTDKYLCYEVYKAFYKREVMPVLSLDDKDRFLRFLTENDSFIYKPLRDHSGHGVVVVRKEDINPGKWLEKTVADNPGVAEEIIVQGKELNMLNPYSVNTCRVETFTIGDEVTVIGVTLRMGVGDSIKDNAGSGGIYASVDPESGVIQSDAKNYNNQHFLFHPTTGCQIIGFQLPDWNDAKTMIKAFATYKKETTLIAWDIAYGRNGWCMVEANDNGDWSIIQSNMEKGKKRLLYNLMDRYFINKNLNALF